MPKLLRDKPVRIHGLHPRRRSWSVAVLTMALLLPVIAVPTVVDAAGCTRTVTSASSLQSAIDGASSGWTICLGANITATNRIAVRSKTGIVIDGKGFTLTSSGYHAALYLQCANSVNVRDLRIVGSHPSPGTFIPGSEHAHGIHVDGGKLLRFDRLDIRNMQGDGMYVGKCGTNKWADTVIIADSKVVSNGRHAITVVAGRHVRAYRMTYHNIAFHIIDAEPDWNSGYAQGATDLHFEKAVSTGWVGRFKSGLVDAAAFYIGTPYGRQSGKYAPKVARITITGYDIREGIAGLRTQLETHAGYRITDVTIKNSIGAKTVAGIPAGTGYVQTADTDYLTVINNRQPVKSGAYVVDATRSTKLVVSGNTGSGLAGQIAP
jgi:hypothetical protein